MDAATNPIIEVSGLTKRFGRTTALDGLELRVGEGEVHGFLGPNGAGKSTTIRILLGLMRASGGSVRILGRDPWAEPVATHRDIAYVPGDVSLWPSLPGGEAPSAVPVEDFDVASAIVLTVIAVGLAAAAMVSIGRRDLAP